MRRMTYSAPELVELGTITGVTLVGGGLGPGEGNKFGSCADGGAGHPENALRPGQCPDQSNSDGENAP